MITSNCIFEMTWTGHPEIIDWVDLIYYGGVLTLSFEGNFQKQLSSASVDADPGDSVSNLIQILPYFPNASGDKRIVRVNLKTQRRKTGVKDPLSGAWKGTCNVVSMGYVNSFIIRGRTAKARYFNDGGDI